MPAATLFVLQLWKPEEFAYVWANWYANFAGFCFNTVYLLLSAYQVLYMRNGEAGAIRFRIMKQQSATSFSLMSDPTQFNHPVDDEFAGGVSWANGEARQPNYS